MDGVRRGSELVDMLADEPVAMRLSGPVGLLADRIAAGRRRRLLLGEWLGHPLHPAMTDLPIGFWTSSMALDLFGGRRARRTSQMFVAMGVAAALPALATGLAEWTRTGTRSGRIAAVHGSANIAATAAYLLSWRARGKDHHLRGVALGLVGALLATASAYLGGHLAFVDGVGVDGVGVDGVGVDGLDVDGLDVDGAGVGGDKATP